MVIIVRLCSGEGGECVDVDEAKEREGMKASRISESPQQYTRARRRVMGVWKSRISVRDGPSFVGDRNFECLSSALAAGPDVSGIITGSGVGSDGCGSRDLEGGQDMCGMRVSSARTRWRVEGWRR